VEKITLNIPKLTYVFTCFVLILAALVTVGACLAQEPTVDALPPIPVDGEPIQGGEGFSGSVPSYMVLVKVSESPLRASAGSGVWLSRDLILTCAHNLRGWDKGGEMHVLRVDGSVHKDVDVVRIDRKRDLALLRVNDPIIFWHSTLDVSLGGEHKGSVGSIGLDPSVGKLIFTTGKTNGREFKTLGMVSNPWYGHDGKVVKGMSGGPVINGWYELVGINIAIGPDTSIAVKLPVIQDFLSTYGKIVK